MKDKREFNFSRRWEQELAKQSTTTSALPVRLLAWGIGGTFAVAAIAYSPWLWTYKLNSDLQSINEKIVSMRSLEVQVQKLNDLKAKIQNSKQFLEQVKKENHDPIEVLNKLKQLLPAGTVINSFSYTGDTVNVAFSVPVPVDAARLWVSLRDSGVFQNVDLQSVSLVDKVQNLNLSLKYNPQANVKSPAPPAQSNGQAGPDSQNQAAAVSTNSNSETNSSAAALDSTSAADKPEIRYPGIPKGITAVPVSNSRIELNWNPAMYAATYNVYRSSSQKGEYHKVANVHEPKYTDTGLVAGTAYYYKISSVKSTGVEGYFDNPVGTVTFDLETPSGLKAAAANGSGQIDLSWNPVNGAAAYRIYRSSGSGSYSLVTAVSDPKYSDKGLVAGAYAYKVNAVADNGKTGGSAEPVNVNMN